MQSWASGRVTQRACCGGDGQRVPEATSGAREAPTHWVRRATTHSVGWYGNAVSSLRPGLARRMPGLPRFTIRDSPIP